MTYEERQAFTHSLVDDDLCDVFYTAALRLGTFDLVLFYDTQEKKLVPRPRLEMLAEIKGPARTKFLLSAAEAVETTENAFWFVVDFGEDPAVVVAVTATPTASA